MRLGRMEVYRKLRRLMHRLMYKAIFASTTTTFYLQQHHHHHHITARSFVRLM
jgi:Fe2+ or Zn2+ uptake regulation protein